MFIFRILSKMVIGLIMVGAIGIGVLGRERMLELVLGPVTYTPIEFEMLQRSASPNQYLVCPPDRCPAKPDATSAVYDVPRAVLRKAWLQLMAAQPRVVQIGISADASQYDFIQRSQWIRFPDVITVKFIDLATNRSTLAIYSRSHYGYSDLGVNRERIESWLQDLDQYLAEGSN
jgi:uncharacterized protein (DUF1499 family)